MEKWSLLQQEEVPDFSTKSADRSTGVRRSGQATLAVQRGSVPRKLLFWAEQQQVAIPGWLCEDQKEGLHQEEHFASRKQPRCPITKENEAKRRIPCCGGVGGGGGGSRWRPMPFSPHPQWRLLVQSSRVPIKSGGFSNPLASFQIRW